jgi:hypothetical protein
MRRIAALVLPVALLASCAGDPEGPRAPAPAAELRGAPAMLQAQVRAATIGFVEAYRATVAGGDELTDLAATPLMRSFAHWLGVTNRAFPGEVVATSTIDAVGTGSAVPDADGVLEVDLSASVLVVGQPQEGDPVEMDVPLDGPVRLAAVEPGSWRVVDFHHFGLPVSQAFVPVDLDFARPGVTVTLEAFGGVPRWNFFVRVAATGANVLTLDEADVALVDGRGEVVGEAIEVSTPLLEVAPGGAIEGALTFEPLEDPSGVSLRIAVGGLGRPATLEIPLSAVAEAQG